MFQMLLMLKKIQKIQKKMFKSHEIYLNDIYMCSVMVYSTQFPNDCKLEV